MTAPRPSGDARKVAAVFDLDSMKPGCVLLQAVHGGSSEVAELFDEWELAPTPGMRMIAGTMDEWRAVAAKSNAKVKS